ncbi:MAG: extracellular solute-binding protein [Planctomycetota bacterium]|nr:extracellular solute-binding protein [Planctomycetota bacterium]
MISRIIVIGCFLLLLAAPFVFRPRRDPPPDDALRLIVITPHNEQIRTEFARAFDDWHQRTHGRRVNVIYNVPGGTSEIRKMLEAQFTAALEAGREPGGGADLVFGGGSYEHGRLKTGVRIISGDQPRDEPISAPVDFSQAWLEKIYGENAIGDGLLYDPDRHWFGTALSGFGIVYNRDVLAEIGVEEPMYWADLCDERLRGWVALVNPGQSGSITTAFEAILQRRGWERGWQILRRAGANARYFSATSLKPPTDVSQGDAAMGVCIDFYGRYQSQAIRVAGGGDRVGYVDPPGVTTIDADPISMLRGAPHPELAKRFIEFCLTEEGQALWQFRVDEPIDDGLGPEQFELRRMPVRRSMYETWFDRLIDQVNPFAVASAAEHPDRNMRSFIAILFSAMAMDSHDELIAAWDAIVGHPAYPAGGEVVLAGDVDDRELKRMLERFDAMPSIEAPGATRLSLETTAHLAEIREGWLKRSWADARLWPVEANPRDEMRRRFAEFFRDNYRRIAAPAAATGPSPAPPGS